MKIYHGTSISNLDNILTKGISPRTTKGNWKKFPSNKKFTYFSVAYPFYFAMCAKPDLDKVVVFEVDTDRLRESLLHPDEDFLSQAKRDIANHKTYRKALLQYQHLWEKSVQYLGNLCYLGVVPSDAITRYCVMDTKKRIEIAISLSDPTVSILNYRVMGTYYQDFVKWCFGDIALIPEKFPIEMMVTGTDNMSQMFKERIEFWKGQSSNREGIEVVKLDNPE